MKNKIIKRLVTSFLAPVMLFTMLSGTAAAGPEDRVEQLMAGMSLEDKVAQMMFLSFRGWPENGAPHSMETLSDTVSRYISARHPGGVIFFAENCHDAEQTLRLAAEVQQANRAGGSNIDLFIAADQEGGSVARLGYGTSGPGNMALCATGDPAIAQRMGQITGEELSLVGINTDFAPVLDINNNPANPVIGVRSFGDDPAKVSAFGSAFMAGLHDNNVIATLKHFPGHGNTGTDSHTGLPLINSTRKELLANELIPFKAAIDNGADMVMTAHIQFPSIDPTCVISPATGEKTVIPATMSKVILTDILRGELGFEGVILSDALEMKAISDNYSQDDILTLTINAGVNMLLPQAIYNNDDLIRAEVLFQRTVELVREGRIDMARIDDSVRRILSLKEKYGLLSGRDYSVTEAGIAAAVAGVGSEAHRQEVWGFSEGAATLLKNENNAFPVRMQSGETTTIFFTAASRAGSADLAEVLLKNAGALPAGADINTVSIETTTPENCLAQAAAADHVIIVSRAWNGASMDPSTNDGAPVGIARQIITACHQQGKTVIVISSQLPYDAACYPDADAILLSYGSSVIREIPAASGAGSAWMPNLPQAVCAALGASGAQGQLPVTLP